MSKQFGSFSDAVTIFLIAAVGSVFIGVLLWFFADWEGMQLLFMVVLAFVLLGALLWILMRGATTVPGGQAASETASAETSAAEAQAAAEKAAAEKAAAEQAAAEKAAADKAAAEKAAADAAAAQAAAKAAADQAAAEKAAADTQAAMSEDFDGDGVEEGTNEGTRPEALDGPRGGTADNLKEIKGIGPKLEKLCNSLGFYHFDQIAGWSADEIAWVNANLEGFKGRVTRDKWVEQAKILAAGGETEFSKRVEDGDVY